MFDVCTVGHTAHIEATVQFLPHSDQHVRCVGPALFPSQRHPVLWNCWYQRLMLFGDEGITVVLSPECPLNWNNWFMLHKLQHTKCFLVRSRHYRCVTSQTEREEGIGIAHEQKTWNTCCFVPCGKTYFCMLFSKPWWRIETAPIILIHPVYIYICVCVCVCVWVCVCVCVCCAFVGLDNKLYKLHDTYVKIKKLPNMISCTAGVKDISRRLLPNCQWSIIMLSTTSQPYWQSNHCTASYTNHVPAA